jgi:ubiquinone/menaquinone biosynthesis C-methylase UbiE
MHPKVAVASVYDLPFRSQSFDLITASNLLFFLSEPVQALGNMRPLLRLGKKVALLNPSEQLL